MAQRETLLVEKREIFGKQLKKLRRQGILPGNVYGKDIPSTAVQLPLKEFQSLFSKVGETGVVDLKLDGKTHPILIHNVALHSLTHEPIHADFFVVNLKEKITTTIPVLATGEAAAEAEKSGILLQVLNEIEVEALPTDLPESVEVDVTPLAAVGDQITVEQIQAPKGVTVLTDPNQSVFRIGELVTQEAIEQEALEEAEAQEQAESESPEGEASESSEASQE